MNSRVEESAKPSIVAILDGDYVCGTGFILDKSGAVLTCHHVIDGLSTIRVRAHSGSEAEVGLDAVTPAPEIDLALIQLPQPLGPPLPVAVNNVEQIDYWTKGYHRFSESIPDAFPVTGRITGHTTVVYSVNEDYRIDGALVLRDDPIAEGLSGAPVLDAESGVVVGVVSTRLTSETFVGGMAVPISLAARHPCLSKPIAANATLVEAYGPYLNVAAAQKLCAAVTDRSLEALANIRNVDLNRRVAREAMEAAVDSFISGDEQILAVLGSSGVGKSTEMAATSVRYRARRPLVLLRGSAIAGNSRELADAIADSFRSIIKTDPVPADVATTVAHLAAACGSPLVVILDALNEAPIQPRMLAEWAAQTLRWVNEVDAKLIVSFRPEVWELVERIFTSTTGESACRQVQLAGFSDDEFRSARGAYDLQSNIDLPILRLPLALSLFTHVRGADGTTSPTSMDQLIELFIRRVSSVVSAHVGPPFSTDAVVSRLHAAAIRLLEQETDHLTQGEVDQLFGAALSEYLVAEGILARAGVRYRFVYDDVAEWLAASAVDLTLELRNLSGLSWRRAGSIAYALRSAERQQGPAVLSQHLHRLLDASDPDDSSLAIHLIEETLLKVADAQPYKNILRRLAGNPRRNPLSDSSYVNLPFWESINLPIADRLDLVRELVSYESSWEWRPIDWSRGGVSRSDKDYHAAVLALDLVDHSPVDGIPALEAWMDDSRQLEGDEATVSDVAMGILYRLRHEHPSNVWSAINSFAVDTFPLRHRIIGDDQQWIVDRLQSDPASTTDEVYVSTLAHLRRSEIDDATASILIDELGRRFHDGVAPEMRHTALATLAGWTRQAQYVQLMAKAYRSGATNLTYALAGLSDDFPDLVLPALSEAIAGGGEPGARAMGALSYSEDRHTQGIADEAVFSRLTALGEPDWHIGHYLENRLRTSHEASSQLLDLIQGVIRAPNGGQDSVIYALVNPTTLDGEPGTRQKLLDDLIALSDAPTLNRILAALIKQLRAGTSATAQILADTNKLIVRMDADSVDELFIRPARYNSEFRQLLCEYLVNESLKPTGGRLVLLTERLRNGESFDEATKAIEDI